MGKGFLALFISIMFILLVSSVAASSYNIELNQIDSKLLVKHIISLDSEQEISIALPSDAYSLSSDNLYTINENILTMTGKNLKVSYLTLSALEKVSDGYYLIDKIKFNFSVDNVAIKLILSEGNFVDIKKIFPEPSSIITDGKQISLIWNLNNVKQGTDLPIVAGIKAKSSSLSWLFLILVVLIALSALYLIYDKLIKGKFSKKEEKSPIESHLIESEKSVLSALKGADRGEMWQKQLQISTGFSKAKLSRVIRNLESRNLIDKIPFGNTNKVRLK
jgi:uncharacterized membrane protein